MGIATWQKIKWDLFFHSNRKCLFSYRHRVISILVIFQIGKKNLV